MSSSGFGLLKSAIDKEAFSEIIESGIDESFFNEKERAAFNYIQRHKKEYGVLPKIETIQAELQTKIDFDCFSDEPVKYYIDMVKDRKQFWILADAKNELEDQLKANQTQSAIENLKEYISQVNKIQDGYSVKDLLEVQVEVLERHDEIQRSPGMTGISFGFPSLDELTYGNQPGDFNVIVGVTGACKSYMCLKSALSAYQNGANVMIISPEMPETQIARRLIGLQANLRDADIRKGRLSYYAVQKAYEKIRQPITIDDEKQDNYFKILPSGMYAEINNIISVCDEYKPDFLCVDGFYLLKNSNVRSSSAWKEDESVIFALKNFSVHSNIPILATTQYNRSKPGKVEGARGTQSVEQVASNFFSLEFENPEDRETNKPIQSRLLKTKKSRDGDAMTIKLEIDFNRMTINESAVLDGGPEFIEEDHIEEI